jgi:hypothetical protein
VKEKVPVPGTKDKARAKLKRILPQPVLPMAGCLGPGSRHGVVAPQQVKHVCRFELRSLVGSLLFIEEQRKRDARLLSKQAGIVQVT